MRLLISTLGLAVCTPVFASDKLNETTGYILNNIELKQNQSFENVVCGTGGCSVDLIEDNMIAKTNYITEEYNSAANTLKIKFSEDNKLLNTYTDTFLVCLDNASSPDKCKIFTQNELASMNYAFENGEFLKGRNKRNTWARNYEIIKGTGKFIASGMAAEEISGGFSALNSAIKEKVAQGYDWTKREATTLKENWNEMNRQREKYETRIDRSDRGDRDRGGSSGGNRERFDRSRW